MDPFAATCYRSTARAGVDGASGWEWQIVGRVIATFVKPEWFAERIAPGNSMFPSGQDPLIFMKVSARNETADPDRDDQ